MALKVHSARMVLSTPNPYNSAFYVDVEVDTASVKRWSGWTKYSWYIDVIGVFGGHGVFLVDKQVSVDMSKEPFRTTVAFRDHPLYCYDGISVMLSFCRFDPEYGEICGQYGDAVFVPSSSIAGYSDYLEWRRRCLSAAKWKREVSIGTPRGVAPGGFIAIFSAVLDEGKRTVTVDVQVDGTTRYGDIYWACFGVPGYIMRSAGIGRSTITIDFSDPFFWDKLKSSGLVVSHMDYSRWHSIDFAIPYDQLERVVELRGSVVGVEPPDGARIEVGRPVSIRVAARSDSSVAVEAYPLIVVKGVRSGAEHARLSAQAARMGPGEVREFSVADAFAMPPEDVKVTVSLYMRRAS